MNISIKSSQSEMATKSPVSTKARSEVQAGSITETGGAVNSQRENVSISGAAQALYAQRSAAERQSSMSQSQLKSLHANTWDNLYSFSQSIANRSYSKEAMLPNTDDPARLEMAQKSLDYAVSLHQSPPGRASNPFAGMERNDLSAVVYDDSGTFTMAERYAASAELRMQDETRFSALAAKLKPGGDNCEVFKGILEYFDDLPLIEKSAYTDGYRDSINDRLQEQIKQWGPLAGLFEEREEKLSNLSETIVRTDKTSMDILNSIFEKAKELSKAPD